MLEPAAPTRAIPPSLFAFSIFYGGMVCIAGVLGNKQVALGPLAVEAGIFAFLLLVVTSSAVAELHGRERANRLVQIGFVPLIVSLLLSRIVRKHETAAQWDNIERDLHRPQVWAFATGKADCAPTRISLLLDTIADTVAISAACKARRAAGEDVYDLSIGEPDFDTPQAAAEAGIEDFDENAHVAALRGLARYAVSREH